MCHTLRGCVDWNSNAFLSKSFLIGHTLRGCVDWNRINGASFLTSAMSHPAWVCGLKLYLCLPILIAFGSHTLRGCVDWNRYSFLCLRKTSVTPCVGVWIETSIRKRYMLKHLVTPCVGVWIETPVPDFPNFCLCHTLRGCVDWNSCARLSKLLPVSHPAWVCGLKHADYGN